MRTIPESKRTVAPHSAKRSRQYFLDLVRPTSLITCRTCGLVYARGLEHDENIHNSFHRSQLKGISVKQCRLRINSWMGPKWNPCVMPIREKRALQGWIGERQKECLIMAPMQVIGLFTWCLVETSCHLNKVREVVKVMEQEMGLSPGWLWQEQRCTVAMREADDYSISLPFSVLPVFTMAFNFLPLMHDTILCA